MHVRQIPQLVRLLFRQGVAKEIATADFRTCKIFQEARLAQRRMELNVKMKTVVDFAVSGGMMQSHDVWEGNAPKVVIAYEHDFQSLGEIAHFRHTQTR